MNGSVFETSCGKGGVFNKRQTAARVLRDIKNWKEKRGGGQTEGTLLAFGSSHKNKVDPCIRRSNRAPADRVVMPPLEEVPLK